MKTVRNLIELSLFGEFLLALNFTAHAQFTYTTNNGAIIIILGTSQEAAHGSFAVPDGSFWNAKGFT